MTEFEIENLINHAIKAIQYAYSPYSGLMIGSALLCKNNDIYTGCNIENVAYSSSVCAERTAVFTAVSSGNTQFKAIAIVSSFESGENNFIFPCGTCRQVLSEFSSDMLVICARDAGDYQIYTLDKLLPNTFELGL